MEETLNKYNRPIVGLAMRQSGPVGLGKILLEHLQFWWPQSGLKKRDHRALLGFSSELDQGSRVSEGWYVSDAQPHQLVSGISRDAC